MNLQEYLDTPADKHEAARIADGMRFLTDLKKTAGFMIPKQEFKTGGAAALNTPIAPPKNTPKAPNYALAGKHTSPRAPAAPAVKKASLEKDAFLHHIPAMARGVGGAAGELGAGIKASLHGDISRIENEARGFKQGLAGNVNINSFGEPIKPGFFGRIGNGLQRYNPITGDFMHFNRHHLIDPAEGKTVGARIGAFFHPNTKGLGVVHDPKWSHQERVARDMATAPHLSPEERMKALIISAKNRGDEGYAKVLLDRYKGFKRGDDINKGFGTAGMYEHLYNTFSNPDGKISLLSAIEGAHKAGILNPENTAAAIGAGFNRVTGRTEEAVRAERLKRLATYGGIGAGGALAGGLAMRGLAGRPNDNPQ